MADEPLAHEPFDRQPDDPPPFEKIKRQGPRGEGKPFGPRLHRWAQHRNHNWFFRGRRP